MDREEPGEQFELASCMDVSSGTFHAADNTGEGKPASSTASWRDPGAWAAGGAAPCALRLGVAASLPGLPASTCLQPCHHHNPDPAGCALWIPPQSLLARVTDRCSTPCCATEVPPVLAWMQAAELSWLHDSEARVASPGGMPGAPMLGMRAGASSRSSRGTMSTCRSTQPDP